MATLAPLREIQQLDLAADAARERSAALPERAELPRLEKALSDLDLRLASVRTKRDGIEAEEERVAAEVADLVRRIEAAEVERYSGRRMDREAAAAHDAAQAETRSEQTALEERQMALLEEIESLEGEITEIEAARAEHTRTSESAIAEIGRVEAEVASELSRLAEARAAFESSIPGAVLSAYDRVRAQPRKAGRGMAILDGGVCGGCHTTLPSLEKSRMLAAAEDALIQCPKCRRVLLRQQ